jgi:hypothetical protein
MFMKRFYVRISYLAQMSWLSVCYQFSAKDRTFWEWCFKRLLDGKERTGSCNEGVLYFLASDAIEHGAVKDAERPMFTFSEDIERSFSSRFKRTFSNFILGFSNGQ